ncbi:hypothetical protein LQW54_007191 [Pestalotiopsis sp. IQ-011]
MARIGKPRRMVVEAAPSHDGSQTFAAWFGADPRPLFALCVYDTTPEASSADHIRHVAEVIYENTWKHRASVGREAPDRIEVVGMPMAAAATDEERARRCREHHEAEVASRISAASREWYIPTTRTESSYWSHIKVLTRLDRGWEEALLDISGSKWFRPESPSEVQTDPFGTCLSVCWDPVEDGQDGLEGDESDEPLPEMSVSLGRIEHLDSSLTWLRHHIEWFYIEYVPHGGLDQELGL